MELGLVWACTSVLVMLLVFILAYFGGALLPEQMPDEVCFPAIYNGAIWGGMIFLSPVLSIVGPYRDQWGNQEIGTALGIGIAINYLLFEFVYLKGKFPDALAGGGRDISLAGWVMLVYGGALYAALGLFYFRTDAASGDVAAVAIFLALYIAVANHAVLGWLNSLYSLPKCPRIFAEEATPLLFIIGGWILLAVATAMKLAR